MRRVAPVASQAWALEDACRKTSLMLLNSPPLIIFNALSLMMSGTILVLKLRNLKNDKRASSAAA
jgi:uncharacterized protein with PQ loop repeat